MHVFFCVSKNVSVSCAYTQGKREQFSGFNRTLDAINNVFRKFSAFHDETGRLNVDGMNIISNDGSNKLNRSRKECRSEERFSRNAETDLVCRLLLEKKKFVLFLVFFPWERILAHERFASLFQSGALSLPSLFFKKRLELGRHQSSLALRQVAAVEVPGNHERQRRAALAGIGAEARRHSPGQATQIAVPPVEHRALAEDDLLLQAVLLDIAAQAVEIRVSHQREDFGMAMERQTLFRHGCLCPVRQR